MSPSILGRKVGMTQIYLDDGRAVPVTVIQAGPCHVLQVRSQDRDGYQAVQLGFEDKPRRLASRAERGHVAKLESKRSKARSANGIEAVPKADCEPQRFVKEFRGETDLEVGATVAVDRFAEVCEGKCVGVELVHPNATVRHQRHRSAHTASRGTHANQLLLVEHQLLERQRHVLDRDTHRGTTPALVQHGERPTVRIGYTGAVERHVGADVFGHHADKLMMSSTKSMHGHLIGGTGAVELLACIMALREGIIAPTIGYEEPDPECALDVVPNEAREANVTSVLSNAFAFGGLNAVLALTKV